MNNDVILGSLGLIFFSAGIVQIASLVYIKRKCISKVETLLFGHSMSDSSALMIVGFAAMNYGGAFLIKWSARRSKLDDKIDNVPENLRTPFKIFFISTFVGVFCLIVSSVFKESSV
jgi:uncharacterized membrane protein